MLLEKLDTKNILMGILASLCGYIFYGYIGLSAKVETLETKQNQVMSEQRDLWGKYNRDLEEKVSFIKDYYTNRLEDQKKWTEYWKEKSDK